VTAAKRIPLVLLVGTALAVAGAADAKRERQPWPTWRALHRPLHLPRVAAGAPCPVSRTRPVRLAPRDVFPLPGLGPAYPVLGADTVLSFLWPPLPSQPDFYGTGWSGNKVMWIVSAAYRGPVLVRGRQLDGGSFVRFDVGSPPPAELRIGTQPTGAGAVRRVPGYTRVRTPGCYAYQIDGATFSRTVIFEARVVPPPR
jgi:hypothetical protein